MKRTYLDYAAGSPVDERVLEVMKELQASGYGNPSVIHTDGRNAKKFVEEARQRVADLVGAEPREIYFTSGATEANNTAIKGIAFMNRDKGKHIVISAIEHISILNSCKFLQKQGFEFTVIPVDEYGIVDVKKLEESIRDDTILISVMYANSEMGSIQPVREIAKIAGERRIPFHTDATAAVGKIPVNVKDDPIDLMTISSNDIYGPRGMGALYIRKGMRIEHLLHGGGQESGIRSGTENVPLIAGFGKAAEIIDQEMEEDGARISKLRDHLVKSILDRIDYAYLNGHPEKRLPTNANIRFSFIEGESLQLNLDMQGVSISTGSACTSKSLEPSRILMAMGLPHEDVHGSLQITLGRWTTEEDVNHFIEVLPEIVERLRAMSPLTPKKED